VAANRGRSGFSRSERQRHKFGAKAPLQLMLTLAHRESAFRRTAERKIKQSNCGAEREGREEALSSQLNGSRGSGEFLLPPPYPILVARFQVKAIPKVKPLRSKREH
ncbi:MAG: hypothetical protein ACK40X_09450, partial [Armatimonadota bacterium]